MQSGEMPFQGIGVVWIVIESEITRRECEVIKLSF